MFETSSLSAWRLFAVTVATGVFAACDKPQPTPEEKPMQPITHTTPSTAPAAAKPPSAAIRPYRVAVPEADLVDLKRRLAATRFPERETVADASQGAQLADLQSLVRYWATDYDWRKAEAKLNQLPQFITTIDGLDIHFIHVRSKEANALPMLVVHGWPGSVFEQLKLVGPLTDPKAHGGRTADAYDLVIPSLPGFGFSGKPTEAGWNMERTARAFGILMKRLGYTRYVAQGGDWGAGVVEAMARQGSDGLIAIHTNLPAALPPEIDAVIAGAAPPPTNLTADEGASLSGLGGYAMGGGFGYLVMMGARPQAVGYGMTDSPAGLAGFMLQHSGFSKWSYGRDPQESPSRDDVLDDFTLYWLTNSAASSARFYWENRMGGSLASATAQKTSEIKVPVAVTAFPDEVFVAPETWARRAYAKLIYFHKADRGGHFAAWQYPELFANELRAAFRTLH
jgi:pimeloyl-ACP methyl ester carboxylesterase